MNRLLFEYDIPASLSSVREIRAFIQQLIFSLINKSRLSHKITLCLSEAINNIVEHSQPTATNISIRFEEIDHKWILKISDNGGTYEGLKNIENKLSYSSPFSESGRGLSLLKANCHHISYATIEHENTLSFEWMIHRSHLKNKILIVEDDLAIRALFERYLETNYTIIVADNGQQALENLESQYVDLIISDINMPKMDGLTLRSHISQSTQNELTPFIFLTANDDHDIQHKANDLGIDDYLIKPVSKTILIQHIERVLNRSKQIIHKLSQRLDSKISESFIPKLPTKINHWNIAFKSLNTGYGGGDFLLHQSNDDISILALFDMMGHDESAKFFSYAYGGFISGVLRNRSKECNQCHQIIKQISDMAYHDDLLSKITLTGSIIELHNDGNMVIASGAHPHPFILDTHSIKPIVVEGVLPGLLPDAKYKPVSILLKKNQRMVFYTDGLFESAEDDASRKQLEQDMKVVIHSTINLPIAEALDNIMLKFSEISATPLEDDTTLLLLEFNQD